MSRFGSRGNSLWLLIVLCLSMGCASKQTTRLCEGFQSYQTVENVRAELSRQGMVTGWKEESQGTDPADHRPPYKLIYLSGPFTLSGIRGQLRLTFYNGRLMETQFATEKGNDYIEALRDQHIEAPRKPAEEIVTDLRTRFRFDVNADGNMLFTWYDPQLEKEWNAWVKSNS